MKLILLGIIHLYWSVFPKHKRSHCVFEESCSNHVFRITKEKGFFSGLLALNKRFHQCRPGYTIYKYEQSNTYELCLKNGSIVREDEIAPTLLPPYNCNYILIK